MTVDLTQLKYFSHVAELKSFTKAAAALHVAQPAITRQIRLLEDELGVTLFLRHSRGAEPTEAALRLLGGAKTVFRLVQEVCADAVGSNSVVKGTLRVGYPPSLGDMLVSAAVAQFQTAYPDTSFTLQEGYSDSLRDALLGDRLDLAVLSGNPANPLLATEYFFKEQLWALRPPGSPSSRSRSGYRLDEFSDHPLIQPSRSNTLRQMLELCASEAKINLKVVVEAESLHTIKHLVRRGIGTHLGPFTGVGTDVLKGDFSGGPVRGLTISRYLVRRVDRPMTLMLIRFQESLKTVLEDCQRGAGRSILLHE